ncbi:DUF2812 domain-containing protein [Staphylococcus pseudintermedius]|uniref:DUF2812 domain-containing protein n=1 Tax=Staphylococcus pseudintermedius TaxID=283734 RepID=UPI0016567832|nr:DUF2812 domain-containing protein [Staphylococcus pseudintermedius]EGQ3623524.1 DUF2812 domain-containing protein [Staphylococcus pseudintermedius]EGQ4092223.1 DUF2812 domain-containing protein [Staphylococcus pseudintermedius]EIK0299966.1 DUF2812 domain-containing protein [Staphylococcus pseudintermedius]EIS6282041.1 DUF2812 domain-containing protein [Staphylococcus pseudintermedius]EJG5111430.1 DUF2812 domain-containing protein [Staphylococcus pseudintermedius]
MKVRYKKWKCFFDPLKEERWLNDQLQQGYRLTRVSFFGNYYFEKTNESHIVRLDYQEIYSRQKMNDYLALYESFGWEHVHGYRGGCTKQYWMKAGDGTEVLFSDRESLSNYYKRWLKFLDALLLVYFALFVTNLTQNHYSRDIFLTPGLWDMEGAQFWRAYLFEFPFAVMRFLGYYLYFILLIPLFVVYHQFKKKLKELIV